MTRPTGLDILAAASAEDSAVAAFNTYTLESTRAVCEAAELAQRPVLLQLGTGSLALLGRELAASSALAGARAARIAIGVHLDHSTNLAEIAACIELGLDSVMVDGSKLPFEENVELTAAVVRLAHRAGVWVEAELGLIPGAEDESLETEVEGFTDPVKAGELVERTSVDALAVAVGNTHGIVASQHLEIPVLREIAEATPAYLVLHGASGIPDDQLRDAVRAGVVKVNVNTELRRAHLRATRDALEVVGDNLARMQAASIDAMRDVALAKITLLAPASGSTVTGG